MLRIAVQSKGRLYEDTMAMMIFLSRWLVEWLI